MRYPTLAKKAILKRILAEALSEEMRILYVAMTRAKDRLIMTYANKFLPGQISKMAAAMSIYDPEYITSTANCPGKWILYTAMHRTEAGELFAMGDRPSTTTVSDIPWKIHAIKPTPQKEDEENEHWIAAERGVDKALLEKMHRHLNFIYPYQSETEIPSKQTATQLKGRIKDREAAENTVANRFQSESFRKPAFSDTQESGVFYGNAIHAAMQYIDFSACVTVSGVEGEIQKLVQQGHLTAEQGSAVKCEHIYRFFQTDLGAKMMSAKQLLREFKFSILEDARLYYPKAENGKILMQGVVDCAMIEDDGVTVLDFKSDAVSQGQAKDAAEKYHMQVTAYARAISRIFQKPIKCACLYFFRCNEIINLDVNA